MGELDGEIKRKLTLRRMAMPDKIMKDKDISFVKIRTTNAFFPSDNVLYICNCWSLRKTFQLLQLVVVEEGWREQCVHPLELLNIES